MSDDLRHLDDRIGQAWAALCGARDASNHSPSAKNLLTEEMCERTVDELLDKRHAMRSALV